MISRGSGVGFRGDSFPMRKNSVIGQLMPCCPVIDVLRDVLVPLRGAVSA